MNLLLKLWCYFHLFTTVACYLTNDIEKDILRQFRTDVEEYCFPPCHSITPLQERVASVKFYQYMGKLRQHIESIAKRMDISVNELLDQIEGHSLMSVTKAMKLSWYADDPRIQTICEIGFNAGHSALNFLVSNPNATVITFDIFRHLYSGFAIQSLHDLMSNRTIVAVAGSSTHSIETFSSILDDDIQCQLIFIDGAHTGDIFAKDLMNMKQIADPDFNILILDDIETKDMDAIYQQWLAAGHLQELERFNLEYTTYINWKLSSDGSQYEFGHGSGPLSVKHDDGQMVIARYLPMKK